MADEIVDVRVDFVSRFVHLSLKAKPDKWAKMYSIEENRNIFKRFFDDPECTTLLILVNQSNGQVQPALEWPQQLKGSRTFYFIKRSNTELPLTVKLGKLLIYGDISPSPIDQLYSFVDEVIFPLITNKMNQTSWPHVVVKDLARQVSAMKNKTYVTTGQIKGKTLLPQPVGTEKMDKAHFNFLNKNLIHSIETVLIEWSHQIHDELKKDSAQPLLDGLSPLPYVEFEFWKVKSINLECIYDQLQSSKIRMFAEFLEKANSSYFATFKSMFQDVVAATVEAQDIYLYLKPLQRILEEMEAKSFEDIRMSYHVLMHCLCLIWTNSNYYNKSERIIVLMQEICNFLITMCRSYLDAHDIFKGEVDETLVKVQTAVNNLIYFKEVFKHYQTKLHSYFKNDDTKEWDFSTQLVFHQYDKFISRVELLKNFFENMIELLKLEKIDYSGLKGKILNAGTAALFKDVNELLKVFQEVTYDALDLTDDSFLKDYELYRSTMFDLDQKLATIACQAFDDCEGLESCFKLCTIFGSLLNRPLVHQQFDPNYPRMLSMMDRELFDVHSLFKKQIARYQKTGRFQLHKNKPQVAGFIEWCLELKERMDRLIVLFNNVNHPCMNSVEAQRMYKHYHKMLSLLTTVETEVFRSWADKVDEEVMEGLKFPLLFRDQETLLIRSNFSTKLVTVLREMKYLSIQVLPADLPEKCINLFASRAEILNYWAILDSVSTWYNKVRTTVLEVEYPIILPELTYIDELLIKAEATLDWSNLSTGEYLQNIKSIVSNFEQRLQQSKDNVEQIQKVMATWSKVPLFDRSEEKGSSLLSFKDAEERARRRYNEIKTAGTMIHDLINQNHELLKAGEASENANYWLAYIDYIDEIVADGFFNIIECSLKFLVDNTANMAECEPLFETVLDLVVPEMFFKPAMQFGIADGFYDMIDGLAGDIYRQAAKIKRVSKHSNQINYQPQMEDLPELTNLRTELMQHVTNIMSKSLLYMESFDQYQSLWLDNRHEFMQQFLCFGHILTKEEITSMGTENIPFTPPSLKQFKEKIEFFEEMYAGIEKMESSTLIENWFRIEAKPFLTSLLKEVNKWIKMMRHHLADHVVNSLSNLEKFIVEVSQGLQRKLVEGDIDALVDVMSMLAKVKERQQKTDEMFEPLKLIIELLKQYQEDLPEEVSQQLQVLPDKWISTKKKAVAVKQQLTPLISYEVGLLKKNVSILEGKQQEFREDFKRIRAFYFDCEDPYKILDEVNFRVVDLEAELSVMLMRGSLFEVSIPDFKQLRQCRKELTMLKNLWDYTYVIRNTIESWKKTPWKEINIDFMDTECKKFSKDLKSLDKEMRSWDVYIGTENVAKNLVTSLKSVTELQNSAIRDRHWMELMQTTGVQFSLTERTTLADLLSLNLHNFEDEVKTIVDKAVKEMSMEKILKELNNTWAIMEFEHEVHQRTKVTLLKASEEMLEIMADNQVQLQNMLSSKFIAHFLDEVSEWQQKLSTADQVITIYMEVQRTWMHLESIFIGSEDIRRQLPEDTMRFDDIDSDFKLLVKDIEKTKNVVEATNQPNLYPTLEALQNQLTLCEKALSNYLETKRLAFPRFYFVSSVDLLDILSNGNNPIAVARHLTKLFDSMAKLTFELDFEGNPTKRAIGMTSKDGEYVTLSPRPCDCEGQVEVWLMQLLIIHCLSVKQEITEAVASYEEKPREVWIFEPPAQPALVSVQIWWCTEVNMAFQRLEEGYENALKEFNKKQISQLNVLIMMLTGKLTEGDRQKIMTICTIEVHNRDVIGKLIAQKVEHAQAFAWLSQLRHRWSDAEKDCFANICDAQFKYMHEYLGNTPRLVITPLTDRCYITLTQSLHLMMSGAPAGPAGTGKTETTKDLGRALGVMVYVFNCSEQMDYKSIGNIYKGLAQSGAWGCFDEFNRISVEVLSVVAVQVKSIQDAIKDRKKAFIFIGEMITLVPTVGIFITMNPGYAGRTELPENLKALFRPCAMVVPDFELICEIMLVAEGFLDARLLARKFITLYTLCKELLSKQDHYDWGLRAIKSVLVVAGKLKRSDPGRAEDQVLMRALRDFNIPKIITDDLPVFMGLIGDLFPALDVPRKRDLDFEKKVKEAILDLKLQAEDSFVLKVVQLQELFEVRHSVFIVGNAGTGKSMVWKSLFKTNQNLKKKPVAIDLDPKAVTNNELFGVINPSTREWKDGLFSVIMRDLAYQTHDGPKWIVLDGDIDPMWIESLNTVMDDNKILTLASNERIPLTPSMRLLFEISHLKTATPATVSRAGILYINPQDLGWNPYVSSWVDRRENQTERVNLLILFDKYIPVLLDTMKSKFKKITPIVDICHLQMLLNLLECMLTPENVPPDCPKEWYEIYFVFCLIWSFGGCLFQDQLVDHRVEFSKWWVGEFKVVKFPNTGTIFDYYIDSETKKFEPWSKKTAKFYLEPNVSLKSLMVDTNETTRIGFFLNLLIKMKRPVMLVGNAGTGKSVLMNSKLNDLGEDYMVANVPFNFYTTSEILQKVLEKPLEKKAGKNYGPRGGKKLIYFIDDMNMPEVDKYFTVQPHTIIRQHLNYGHWYDRIKLSLKEIHGTQYVSCMNPTAGSFTIDSRLQRHFAIFALSFPGGEALNTIYNSILSQHASQTNFSVGIQRLVPTLVTCSLFLHSKIASIFLPTATKFHYIYNLRDISNIFQGLLFSTLETITQPYELVRLWVHETHRVYRDKLVDETDMHQFDKLVKDTVKKHFEELPDELILAKPLLYCHFAASFGDPKYMPVLKLSEMNKMIVDALNGYNEVNTMMSLVLFEDAIYHIMRINRILESPRGNALLIGVGGSGKQSLSRLAAYISSLDVFQVSLKKGYGLNDLKADLAVLYLKAGLKNLGIMFLMTEGQVPDEKFLVLINDLLASGEIPELFPDDELDNIVNAMRPEVKATGLFDSRENCWKFFIERIRQLLKVVLCFSPQGSTLRNRSRKFPAIINTTCIDWFHEWPIEALVSVSRRFLGEIEGLTPDMCDSISDFMSHVHQSVNEVSVSYLMNERRYNYTTPKSFLEQISLYRNLVSSKFNEIHQNTIRLVNGLEKLESASGQVDELKKTLVVQEKELAIKNEEANKLIAVVKGETDKVSAERAITNEEEKKVKIINDEVSVKFIECEADLRKAQPALDAAKAALDTLNRNNLTELKGFTSPPSAVVKVAAAVMVLMSAPSGKVPKDRSWKSAKGIMGKVDDFLLSLINYKKESIPPMVQKAVQPYLDDPEFEPEYIKTKSFAAAGLCAWVINIMKFYEVFCEVEPKRLALEDATRQLNDAEQKLNLLRQKLAVLQEALGKLTKEYEKATKAKAKCQAEADQTAKTIDLSNRLVLGLASENVRWHQAVETFNIQAGTVPGDILLVTAFISYVGCFTKPYRVDLMENHWLPYFRALPNPIPTSENLDIMGLLSDDAKLAKWQNEGLPNDRMSSENATILTNAERWPLMIDPQLQGIKWIKRKYGDKLVVVRLNQKNYIDKIEKAISDGEVVLIENIDESIDPILDPIIGRNTIKKGKVIRVGDKEINFNKNFRLILHTKLANPHYKPELQAQTTLINFTVTKDSLEDQLLAMVVAKEQPELEVLKADLTRQQNEYKITLKHLEDSLLARLSEASGNFLGDYELVENLETTKRTSADVEEKVKEAKVTEAKINEFREAYRVAGSRGSLLYFILNDLNKIHPMYQFSLKAFGTVFELALQKAEPAETPKQRLMNLIDCITFSVFQYTSRGLFESDKIIFMTQMTFQILLASNDMALNELDFLLRFPVVPISSPVDFLSSVSWGGVKTLSAMEEFKNLDRDIEGSSKRWKKFVESETPEQEKFPQEWKNKTSLQKLCMMRTLRPDRMTYTIKMYVEEKLGKKFVDIRATEFSKSYEESTPSTPIFFILSPGVDPLKDVEKLGKVLGFTFDNKNFHNISLGQGQEIVAENAMDTAAAGGHWVILQNVHLVAKWLPSLEKKLEQYSNESHPAYRVFISAEAASNRDSHIMPQGILESAIKITNEPPTGMFANLHKALDIFSQDTLDMCAKEMEFKSILFALCYFHAVVSERRKFGPQGWNRMYPFNFGDLSISVSVLYNYLEANSKLPWEDLRYLFGEIMYGGHITDDWDRRLCKTYLEEYMNPFMLDGELYLAPGFPYPPNLDYKGYHNYIDDMLPNENPVLYGLHPNAEIDILSQTSEALFRSVFELQPRDAGFGATGGVSREEKIKGILDDIRDKLPEQFLMQEIMSKVPPEERTPYVVVAFQECERMNILTTEIKRSLIELNLGLKGELTITADMENLSNSLYMDIVPETWALRAYPSLYNLTPWYADLLLRIRELEMWTSTFAIAGAVWLAGFFNPQSFLTAIMQQMARKNEWPLDKMCLQCDVLKKSREEIGGAPREGAYVCGLFMEGARWDVQSGMIAEAKLKELAPAMPVIYIKAIPVDRQETKNIYECPVYKTKQRGPTFVWKFNLKTKDKPSKWILGGVALLLQI